MDENLIPQTDNNFNACCQGSREDRFRNVAAWGDAERQGCVEHRICSENGRACLLLQVFKVGLVILLSLA